MNLQSLFNALPQHKTLRKIVLMRTITLSLQGLSVTLAHRMLDIILPLTPLVAILTSLVLFNGWTWWRMRYAKPAGNIELFIQFMVDIIGLSALLYYTGGATNPFVSFYLPVIAVSSTILPWRFSSALSVLSLMFYSTLTSTYIPLDLEHPDRAMSYHLSGMWVNFVVSAGLITWFVTRISNALRESDAQLSQAQERYLQNEKIVALGTQAAHAAHEISTPLSTIAVVAGDLKREILNNAALTSYQEDIVLIESQIALCKAALDQMKLDANPEISAIPTTIVLKEWLKTLIDTWRLRHPESKVEVDSHAMSSCEKITIHHVRPLEHILTILMNNAAQASKVSATPIQISIADEDQSSILYVKDHGTGIDPDLLKRLGYEPVKSTTNGQGIGLMLAFATARQMGATLTLTPLHPHGTLATLTWPL